MYSENLSISEVKANLFDKRTVVQLNENQLINVNGGTTLFFEYSLLTDAVGGAYYALTRMEDRVI